MAYMIRTFKEYVQNHLTHTGEERKSVFGKMPLIC